MSFEWDERKAAANLAKHGIDFADAVGVFFDELAITIENEGAQEERFVTLGADALNRVVVVAYTWRGRNIRIISVRAATRAERRLYEAHR